jgi:hypothetical protein
LAGEVGGDSGELRPLAVFVSGSEFGAGKNFTGRATRHAGIIVHVSQNKRHSMVEFVAGSERGFGVANMDEVVYF